MLAVIKILSVRDVKRLVSYTLMERLRKRPGDIGEI